MKKVNQNVKDGLLVTSVLILMVFAVCGDGFSDLANKKFWWVFWEVACVIGWVGCFVGWLYLKGKDRKQTRQDQLNK